MASVQEVKSVVSGLEKSPSKTAGGSTTKTSMSPESATSASGKVGPFKSGCFGGGKK